MRGLRLMRVFRRCRTGRGISLCVVALAGVGVVLALSGTAVAAVSRGFIENRGQLDERVLFYTHGSRISLYFTAEAVVIDLREEVELAVASRAPGQPLADLEMGEECSDPVRRRGCAVWIRFEGAERCAAIEARGELATRYNYFLGDDPEEWRTDVPLYAELAYRDLWPGIDLVYRSDGGAIEYEFVGAPGAAPGGFGFRYEGGDRVTRDGDDGSYQIETPAGLFLDTLPGPGRESGSYGWVRESANWMQGEATVPARGRDDSTKLLWSSFLGGSGDESGIWVVLDSLGSPVVTGPTGSSNFPTTPGAYDESLNGGSDVFVAKLDATGSSLLWSTFLGGSGGESGYTLALDSSGNPVVSGQTASPDFPTTQGAYDQSYNGGSRDVFVAKLSGSGNDLLWSTFLGGFSSDAASDIVLDLSENPVVTTYTTSGDFPTTPGAYDESFNGGRDVSVTKLDASGSALLWSTFLGGTDEDTFPHLALDPSGQAVVIGRTQSGNFPTTPGAYDESHNDRSDVFVAKLDATGSSLLWSTFLGGGDNDNPAGLALDPASNVVVSGATWSPGFPTTPGAYDESFNGEDDIFVAKLDVSGTALLWSTFVGGTESDEGGRSPRLGPEGGPVVTGWTRSPGFPTTPWAYDRSFNGVWDAFVAQLDHSGSDLLWSTYLGGNGYDVGYTLALDSSGNPVVSGTTASPDFPTTPGAYDPYFNGAYDVFLAKLDLTGPTHIPDHGGTIPLTCVLRGNFPNPFGPATLISYDLPSATCVSLRVYDVSGRLVRELWDARRQGPGQHEVPWDGRDHQGRRVPSGVYFCRLEADGEVLTGQMILLK